MKKTGWYAGNQKPVRIDTWAKFTRDLAYKRMPEDLTLEDLAQISARLKI
jgi:hypothetical protein